MVGSTQTQRLGLVLLPGMDGTGELFSGFVDAVGDEFGITTLRYPTGKSLSYSELEGLVRRLCPSEKPFVLLAESYSTPLAIKFAASQPAGLAGLVLCVGFSSSPVRGWRRWVAWCFASVLFYVPIPDFAVRRWLVGLDANASVVAAVRAAIGSVKRGVMAGRLRAVLACDVRREAGKIGVPTLYVGAMQDRLVGSWCAEELLRIDPGIAVAALAGPHLLLQRRPRAVAEVVLGFVRSRVMKD